MSGTFHFEFWVDLSDLISFSLYVCIAWCLVYLDTSIHFLGGSFASFGASNMGAFDDSILSGDEIFGVEMEMEMIERKM